MANKNLIIYFSHTGENMIDGRVVPVSKGITKIVAERIEKEIGGADTFELIPDVSYPYEYSECCKRARDEYERGLLPTIKDLTPTHRIDVSHYDTIYIGFPIWYRTFPRIILSFLKLTNLSGKVIKPFCTNDEGYCGYAQSELNYNAQGALIKGFLCANGKDVLNGEYLNDLQRWLKM